jgi:hypothetical protein
MGISARDRFWVCGWPCSALSGLELRARPGAESVLSPDETAGGKDGVDNL